MKQHSLLNSHGYSLLEMLVVVFLLSLLATLGFNRLSTNNADRYYAEVCINTLYEPIASYVYAAMTSRVLTGDEIPKEYLISQKNHKFSLDYTNQSGETHSYLQLDINTIAHCQRERKYKILIPSPETKITMLPSLQGIEPQPGFHIKQDTTTERSLATGSISFSLCTPVPENGSCSGYDFAEIMFDARVGSIKKKFCKLYGTGDEEKKCKQRNTGE